METLYKWPVIGGLSLIGLTVCLIIMPFNHIMTVSIAILCSIALVISIVHLYYNRSTFFYSTYKLVWDARGIKKAISSGVIFTVLILVLALILELILVFLYFIIPNPFYPYYEGIEYYQSNEYRDFRWGKEASRYLPAYDELEGAESIAFTYNHGLSAETLYTPTDTKFEVEVYYDPTQYATQKEAAIQNGEFFGSTPYYGDAWLLEKKTLVFGNHLYYVVLCSDEECKLTYHVSVQNSKKYTEFGQFPSPGA